ncbi:hypothetical protein LUZ60_013634 [Juncus effusus]|nr:hypothetical protein LUZ60_013634 [Juncus effusus]
MRLVKKAESLLKIRNQLLLLRRQYSASPMSSPEDSGRYSFEPALKWDPQVEAYLSRAYGPDHFARISSALTRPSRYSSIRVNTLKSSVSQVKSKLEALLHSTDFSVSQSPGPGLQNVLYVQGSGPHSVDYDRQPGAPMKEVVVSRKCAESVLRGAQVYVPGVMACSAHVEEGDRVAVSVGTEQPGETGGWAIGITRGTVLQGQLSDVQYKERHGLYIGQGTALMSRAGIFRANEGVAIQMTDRVYNLPSFNNVLEGEIFLQNLPSIVTARVLDPQAGERILDMCAAPGGKTTAIAILMGDKGEIVALDRSHNKVMGIMRLANEMGINSIKAYKLDALKSVNRDINNPLIINNSTGDLHFDSSDINPLNNNNSSTGDLQSTSSVDRVNSEGQNGNSNGRYLSRVEMRKKMRREKNGPGRGNIKGGRVVNSQGFMPDSFDRVLLDAPCSALGLRPRLFAAEETIDSLRRHGTYQRRMFDQAVQLVRPGGIIVYSTCTINPRENESLVRYALDTYKFLSLAPQNPRVGGPGIVGRCEFDDNRIEEWLSESEAHLVQRFDPTAETDTIGFFIAKFNVGEKNI